MKAKYGYMGKILFVNLSDGKVWEEELSEDLAKGFIGGYGLGARILLERMKPRVDPLGSGNILGIGTGPFTGTGAISTSRFTTMGKSPLTGFWGDANSGGNFAVALKASGYDMLFFEGKSENPVYLLLTDGKAELKDARHIWGKDTAETEKIIRKETGDSALRMACIGMAGEKCSRISAIVNDGGRAAGRSGLGAVMGSKNLKAVACRGSKKPEIFDKDFLQSLNKELLNEFKNNPGPMAQVLSHTGTPGAVVPHLADHDTPIKNWGGNNIEDFPEEKWGKVGYEAMEKYITKKYACTGCPIACGGWMKMEGDKYTVKKGHKPEYETIGAFGPNCLNDNVESVIYANELCNLHGFDTISAGATIAFAIECFENGILTKGDTDGVELTWGNADAMIQILEKMCRRKGIGDLLADGAKEAANKIGKGAEQFAMHVGGELAPMHDPRCSPGWGATYVSDAVPARHTRGGTQFAESGMAPPHLFKTLGLPPQIEKYNPKGKGKMHAVLAGWQHLINTAGLCLFAHDGLTFKYRETMNAITGWDLSVEELIKTGKRIHTVLHAFNLREGFKPSDYVIPPRIEGKPPFKVGAFKDLTLDIEELKRQFYEEGMGFDYKTGEIPKDKIKELGLEDILF